MKIVLQIDGKPFIEYLPDLKTPEKVSLIRARHLIVDTMQKYEPDQFSKVTLTLNYLDRIHFELSYDSGSVDNEVMDQFSKGIFTILYNRNSSKIN